MNANNNKYILISTQKDLDYLINRIFKKELFANEFKFTKRILLINLLDSIGINYEDFSRKYFYFDRNRNIHISESEFGNVWISTFGLVARNKTTNNNIVNSCAIQYTVISILLDKAIEISQSETVYDIDSYNFGQLSELTPALFQNIVFYIEVFCKAYLSINGITPPFTHKLSIVYSKLAETMFDKKHNDSLFQARIVDQIYKIVEYVNTIPGNFKEQFVKYDDNSEDSTVIIFQPEQLDEMKVIFELCHDFIVDFFYERNESHYLKTGLFQKLLDKAQNDEEREKIQNMYGHLIESQKITSPNN